MSTALIAPYSHQHVKGFWCHFNGKSQSFQISAHHPSHVGLRCSCLSLRNWKVANRAVEESEQDELCLLGIYPFVNPTPTEPIMASIKPFCVRALELE